MLELLKGVMSLVTSFTKLVTFCASLLPFSASTWPDWALRTIIILLGLIVVVNVLQFIVEFLSRGRSNKIADGTLVQPKPTKDFRIFQLQYLSVFLIIMLADWLQGP